MADCHLSSSIPCTRYNVLLERQCSASSLYYSAVAELVLLAGKHTGAVFDHAKQTCQVCLANCRAAAEAVRAHKAAHRC